MVWANMEYVTPCHTRKVLYHQESYTLVAILTQTRLVLWEPLLVG